MVAPVFPHGDGMASVGGLYYVEDHLLLSEEDGVTIIADELSSEGINISTRCIVLSNVCIPMRSVVWTGPRFGTTKMVVGSCLFPLTLTGVDESLRVGVLLVSKTNYVWCGGPFGPVVIDAPFKYDMKETADYASRSIEAQATGMWFGVFYDPVVPVDPYPFQKNSEYAGLERKIDEAKKEHKAELGRLEQERRELCSTIYAEERNRAHAEAERLLRLQVRDFVKWLKDQGALSGRVSGSDF